MRCSILSGHLIVAWRLLASLALLVSLVAGLDLFRLAPRTNLNLACGDSAGLIKAINQANQTHVDETITLNTDHQANCVYTLNTPYPTAADQGGLPSISGSINIEGQGAMIERSQAIGTPFFRIFQVTATGKLTLNQVIARNGRVVRGGLPANSGGGIANFGEVKLINSIISGNEAKNGGGIFNDSCGSLSLTNSAVNFNSGASFGGGVFNQGTLSLVQSTVSGNQADLSGGGIANFGALSLVNSAVSYNGRASLGGGIFNQGRLSLSNSTIIGNSAGQDGGGIFNDSGKTVYLTDSLVSGNHAKRTGGGIFNFEKSELSLTHSTIGDNSAGGDAGGIYNHHYSTLSLIHSLVSDNIAQGKGGGIVNRSMAMLSLSNSTVNNNRADEAGGGIANFGTLSLIKCSIAGNKTGGRGGGIFNNFQTLTLADSLIIHNSSEHSGGGIFNRGEVFLSNSVVAYNPSGGDCISSGTLYSHISSLIGDESCGSTFSDRAKREPAK